MAWEWISAWIGASVVAALVFHRMRSRTRPVSIPPEVGEFLRRFEQEIATRHPQIVLVGMVPGKFAAVLEIHGQQTPVTLHALFRHWRTYPEAFPRLVDRLVQEVEEEGLDQPSDHLFEDVATRILPQLRSRAWVGEAAPRFGDSAIVYRPHGNDLAICYVIDDAWSLVFVSQAHLRQWRCSEADLYHLAIGNLRRLGGPPLVVPEAGAELLFRQGDGYDATRALLLDPEQVEGLLVGIPERDSLWLSRDSGQSIMALMAVQVQRCEDAAHPVSSQLYRVHDGELVPLRPDSELH